MMTAAERAMLDQAQIFNAWLAKSLKENQVMLAESRDRCRVLAEQNERLAARLKAAGK